MVGENLKGSFGLSTPQLLTGVTACLLEPSEHRTHDDARTFESPLFVLFVVISLFTTPFKREFSQMLPTQSAPNAATCPFVVNVPRSSMTEERHAIQTPVPYFIRVFHVCSPEYLNRPIRIDFHCAYLLFTVPHKSNVISWIFGTSRELVWLVIFRSISAIPHLSRTAFRGRS